MGAPWLSLGQEFRRNGSKHQGIDVFLPRFCFSVDGAGDLGSEAWSGFDPTALKAGTPGSLLLPSPNFLALEVVAGALPRPISERMKREKKESGEGGDPEVEEEEEMAVNGSRRARPCSGGCSSQRGAAGSLGLVGKLRASHGSCCKFGRQHRAPVASAPDTAPEPEPAAPAQPDPERRMVCKSFPS